MEIQHADKIRERIMSLYNKDPGNWHIMVGRDEANYLNSVILHESEMWVIKEEVINPYRSIGCGVKTEVDESFESISKNPYSFGLRPVPYDPGSSQFKNPRDIIESTLKTKPVPYSRAQEIRSPIIIQGPVITPSRPFALSKAQEELDRKLRKSLRSLINRKFPEMTRSYI